jgi:hypothetical protein
MTSLLGHNYLTIFFRIIYWFLFSVPFFKQWYSDIQALAKIDSCVIECQLMDLCPQFQSIAPTAAFETMKYVFFEIR